MPRVLPSSLAACLMAVGLIATTSPVSGPASAADPAAGKATAEAVCAACHGGNGISVSGEIPKLAGQKAKYLAGQLEAFRGGARKNAVMNAVAVQLDDTEIENLAAHFAGLPAGPGQETSALFPELVGDRVTFPTDFKDRYTRYTTISFEKRKQVRHYYASPEAVAAARARGSG